jgi:lipid II:glycine glycyltransferase (peptidoglycan interpeptide bridge formation enzyme)
VVSPDRCELLGELLDQVHALARKRRAAFLKIEPPQPSEVYSALGFRPSTWRVQMRTTLMLDLTLGKALFDSFKSKTRYNIRLAARKGVEIREGGLADLPVLYNLLEVTSKRDQFPIRPMGYYAAAIGGFGSDGKLLLAYYDGQVIAANYTIFFGPLSVYLYGASADAHRNLMPNYLLQWEAIQEAMARGCKVYDFWGIPDDVDENQESDPNKTGGMWGVYRFKSGFNGRVLRHPAPLDYVYQPARYWVWNRLWFLVQRWRGSLMA